MCRTRTIIIALTVFGSFPGAAQNHASFDGFKLVDKEGIIRKPADYRDTFHMLGSWTVIDPKGNQEHFTYASPDTAEYYVAKNFPDGAMLVRTFADDHWKLSPVNTHAFASITKGDTTMTTVMTKDGAEIYYKDWGAGQPVVFSHGWPLSSEAWAGQMLFLAQHGYRVIAHDRRGHGRSSQTSSGNDMNTYADDLAAVINHLDLKNAVLVGHSTGGGEITRYIGRHGTKLVEKVVLIAAVPPILLKSDANPEGIPIEVFDGLRASLAKDPSQFYKDFAMMFYGANRAGAKVSQGILDQFWLWSMQGSVKSIYECIKAFSETDFTEDLKKFEVPTLVLHGEDDQVVPVMISSKKSAKLIRGAQEIYFPAAPHGVTATDPDRINAGLLEFLKKGRKTSKAA